MPSRSARVALVVALLAAPAAAASLEERLLAEGAAALAAAARSSGDAKRGAAVFHGRSLACAACHAAGADAATAAGIGPDITSLDKSAGDAAVVESILEPSKVIAPAYAPVTFELADGRIVTGVVVEEGPERIVVRDAAQPERLVPLTPAEIEGRSRSSQSIMPAGQVNQLADRGQFLDLVRYVLEVRDGGAKRARELAPRADPLALKFPDDPRPWQPVVQRGDLTVGGVDDGRDLRVANAVALGFAAGSVAFDATALEITAAWRGGFVRHAAQPYFGVFWHRAGDASKAIGLVPRPLAFRTDGSRWQGFEPAATSDPNTGSRFMGYAVAPEAVRLQYRGRVGAALVEITEDVRVEERAGWLGVIRSFRFTGLPAGSAAAVAVSESPPTTAFAADGSPRDVGTLAATAAVAVTASTGRRIAVGGAGPRFAVVPTEGKDAPGRLALTADAGADGTAAVQVAEWVRGGEAEVTAADVAAIVARGAAVEHRFDGPARKSPPPPEARAAATAERRPPVTTDRDAIDPRRNVDDFPATRAKFVRFVITRTADSGAPCIDEVEIYGPADDTKNLALDGTASASSVMEKSPIHRIEHLNDGKVGNARSWIAGAGGPSWVQVELPELREVRRVVWGRDREGTFRDRLVAEYRVEVSEDGAQWRQVASEVGRKQATTLAVGAVLDVAAGYEAQALPPPFPGCRVSDVAFSADGVVYCIAMTEGQVWRTRIPPPDRPTQVAWQRYATGLYHPIGLAVVDGRLFVAQKPEITELIDHDGDGTVDRQRTVATGWGLSTGWHEYCFGLAVDPKKDLWFALNTGYFWTSPGYVNPGRLRGSVFKVEHGSERLVEVATGCRVPNGIAAGADGEIFFTDNQGDWIQSCKLAHVVAGRFYGHPETTDRKLAKDVYPDGRVAVWLPHGRSRSSSGPAFDTTGGAFGPFAGQWFVGDVGYGSNTGILRAALEKVDGEYQGAVMPFIDGQPRGCERLKFGPDGRLWMATLTDGIVRVAFSGTAPLAIQDVAIRPAGAGFTVRFTKPLAESCAVDPARWKVQRWHYLYTGQYGSPQADLAPVPVTKVDVSSDRTEVVLTLPVETYPIGMVYEIAIADLTAAGGETLKPATAWYTVHRIPK